MTGGKKGFLEESQLLSLRVGTVELKPRPGLDERPSWRVKLHTVCKSRVENEAFTAARARVTGRAAMCRAAMCRAKWKAKVQGEKHKKTGGLRALSPGLQQAMA